MARADIKRGGIWMVDLGMMEKRRPVVVLSVDYEDHERALVTYVVRTTAIRGTRFEVPHEGRGFNAGVFDAQNLGTVPAVRLERKLASLNSGVLAEIEAAVRRWLGL